MRHEPAFALFQIGEIELGGGDPNTALGYFLDALEASPDDISALSGKAHALGQAGQIQTATANYTTATRINPMGIRYLTDDDARIVDQLSGRLNQGVS